MTQPNFLQVQTSLDRARAFAEAHPDLSSSVRYGAALAGMRDRFNGCTDSTDASYARWRNARSAERSGARDVKHELDRVAALADEHAYDDVPRRRIIYTDSEQLLPLANETAEWLKQHVDDWEWTGASIARLKKLLDEVARLGAEADRLYQQYTVEVKRRVTAYDDAVALLREYYRDARREAAAFSDFESISVDAV